MSRHSLIHIPNGLYSVVSKCNNNEFLFDAHAKFELYLQHLLYCKSKLGFTLYDIACVSNHVHELYRVPDTGVTIADILHRVKGHFAQKFNAKFGRTGHFWRNKPSYRIVENEDYAINTCRYFHWNAVRAGLVDDPAKWPYSGYRFHELGERGDLVGRLLTGLPPTAGAINISGAARNDDAYFLTLMRRTRLQFIGSPAFMKEMRHKFRSKG